MAEANSKTDRLEPTEWLEIVSLGPVLPLETEFGVDTPTAPMPLIPHLFATIDPSPDEIAAWGDENIPEARTYAILDASVLTLLPEMLETSELHHKCLFTGKALAEFGDAAPWLVKLEPDHPFTRNLMMGETEPAGLWHLRLGIFIRSRQPLDVVWRHLRKFTRVQDDDGTWFFNRFWSAPVSTKLMEFGNVPDLQQFVAPLFPTGRDTLQIIVLSDFSNAVLSRKAGTVPPTARPRLTQIVQDWMRYIRRVQQFEEIIAIAQKHVEKQMKLDTESSAIHLRSKREKFFKMGFWRRDHLTKLCVWELMLGPEFIDTYADGQIKRILISQPSDWEAIKQIGLFLEPAQEPTDAEIQVQMLAEQKALHAGVKPSP